MFYWEKCTDSILVVNSLSFQILLERNLGNIKKYNIVVNASKSNFRNGEGVLKQVWGFSFS